MDILINLLLQLECSQDYSTAVLVHAVVMQHPTAVIILIVRRLEEAKPMM